MSRKLTWTLLALGVWAAIGAAALAQDEAVLLRYHFLPGQALAYRVTFNATASMSMNMAQPGQTAPMVVPVQANGYIDLAQKVAGVDPQGTADVDLSLGGLMVSGNAAVGGPQATMQVVLANGQLSLLVNGQAKALPKEMDLSTLPLVGKPLRVRMSNTGQLVGLGSLPLEQLGQMLPGMDLGSLLGQGQGGLPQPPVRAGESWSQQLEVPVPGSNQKLRSVILNKFAGWEQLNGRRVARLEVTGNTDGSGIQIKGPTMPGGTPAPTMTIERLSQRLGGVIWFDPELGQPVKATYDLAMTQKMSGMGPGGQGGSMGMDLRMKAEMALRPGAS